MADLQVNWTRCGDDYCSFENVNLSNVTAKGVYVIWYNGRPGKVVRIGQGDISARLNAHRNDPEITQYASHDLKVTWASVDAAHRDGVERYLADTWHPLVGDAFPDVQPIAVNSPFAA